MFDANCNSVVLRASPETDLPGADRARILSDLKFALNSHIDANGDGLDSFARPLGKIGCSPRVTELLHLWTEVLCELSGASGCGVRLEKLDRQMCPNFHFDRVTARMLVTWHGETTDLATAPDYAQRLLGDESLRKTGAGGDVLRAEVGDLVLMKGDLWPDLAVGPAVHRSPEVPEGEQRLMCTWDPMD